MKKGSGSMFTNKAILITGGTGSFGNKMTKYLLDNYDVRKIVIYSRDEFKQWQMAERFKEYANKEVDNHVIICIELLDTNYQDLVLIGTMNGEVYWSIREKIFE